MIKNERRGARKWLGSVEWYLKFENCKKCTEEEKDLKDISFIRMALDIIGISLNLIYDCIVTFLFYFLNPLIQSFDYV